MQEATSGAATGAGIASGQAAAEAGSIGPAQVDTQPAVQPQSPLADLEQAVEQAVEQARTAAQVQPASGAASEPPIDNSGSAVASAVVQEGGSIAAQPAVSPSANVQPRTDTVVGSTAQVDTEAQTRTNQSSEVWQTPKKIASDKRFVEILDAMKTEAQQQGGAVDEKAIEQQALKQYYQERALDFLRQHNNDIPQEVASDKDFQNILLKIENRLLKNGEQVDPAICQREALSRYLYEDDLNPSRKVMTQLLLALIAAFLATKEIADQVVKPQQQAA